MIRMAAMLGLELFRKYFDYFGVHRKFQNNQSSFEYKLEYKLEMI